MPLSRVYRGVSAPASSREEECCCAAERMAVRPSVYPSVSLCEYILLLLIVLPDSGIITGRTRALAAAAFHYYAVGGGSNEEEPVQRLFIGGSSEPGMARPSTGEEEEDWRKLAVGRSFSLSLSLSPFFFSLKKQSFSQYLSRRRLIHFFHIDWWFCSASVFCFVLIFSVQPGMVGLHS